MRWVAVFALLVLAGCSGITYDNSASGGATWKFGGAQPFVASPCDGVRVDGPSAPVTGGGVGEQPATRTGGTVQP